MKRLLLSAIGGVIIPFCYSIIAGPLSTYTENRTLHLLLDIPIGWPRLLYFYLYPPFSKDSFADNEIAFLLYIIGCDIVLYALLVYFILWVFSKKHHYSAVQAEPPPPV